MEKYLSNFKNCLQNEVPFCNAECPFHLDIHSFIEKLQRGAFNGAYKDYRNAVGFPAIVSALCPAYCKNVCPMDQSINLSLLEIATIEHATKTDPPDYNLPKKKGRIAIVGGGLSGMGCALRLTTKKYDVELFERSNALGGQCYEKMDSYILQNEFRKQFQFEEVIFHINTEIINLSSLNDFNAIYIATGKNGSDFGLLSDSLEAPCYIKGKTGIFAGGSLLEEELMPALASGLRMGTTIDNFLKTSNLIYTLPQSKTNCLLDSNKALSNPEVIPKGKTYTCEEAIEEALRCLKCQCDACRMFCDLTDFYNKWPVRIRDEIQATTLPSTSELKATPAKRLINTCTQCGLCKEVCPEDIDLGRLILDARKSMHKQEKMAPIYNEFFLRDMEFTNGPLAGLCKSAPNSDSTEYIFFPGCQLGADDPQLVIKPYDYLLNVNSSTGLMLGCCGIPAEWAGNDELLLSELEKIHNNWIALGKPTLILACPTCANQLTNYLPDIKTIFLYDYMVAHGISSLKQFHETRCIFDPCATRNQDALRNSVRILAKASGFSLKSLPIQEGYSSCCSYGGHNKIANPEFAEQVVNKRIHESNLPYIAYCINCRDAFLAQGKDTLHILDILFDRKPTLVTATMRRENRIILKEAMLKKYWDETMKEKKKEFDFTLEISEKLKNKLDSNHILEEDLFQVCEFCLQTGRFVTDQQNHCSGYEKIGHATYWVEFIVDNMNKPKAITLLNGYSHRMEIELEEVWNGHKININV